jgi:hypothetical protein
MSKDDAHTQNTIKASRTGRKLKASFKARRQEATPKPLKRQAPAGLSNDSESETDTGKHLKKRRKPVQVTEEDAESDVIEEVIELDKSEVEDANTAASDCDGSGRPGNSDVSNIQVHRKI